MKRCSYEKVNVDGWPADFGAFPVFAMVGAIYLSAKREMENVE